jgi:hypothetical protein
VHFNLGVHDDIFVFYTIAFLVSGLLMTFLGVAGFRATGSARVLSTVAGLAALGYGAYLAFFFDGGEYLTSRYVFILPIVVIINIFRSRRAAKAATAPAVVPQFPQQPVGPSQPFPYGPPPQPAPAFGQAQPQFGQPQPQFGQPPYGPSQGQHPQYGQPQPGQPQYDQSQSPQPQPGQARFGQPPYGQAPPPGLDRKGGN